MQADGVGLRFDGTANTSRTIFFRNTTSSNPAQVFSDGSFRLYTEDSGTDIRFHTNSDGSTNERMRVTANGVTFNGDNASANALDDYEEGTWTPTITSGVNSISYNVQSAHYIKIGHQVFCDFYLNYSGTGSGAQFIVSSLPYTQKNTNHVRGGGCSTYQNLTSNTVQFYGAQGTVYFYCYVLGSNSFTYSGSISSKYLIGTFSYISA